MGQSLTGADRQGNWREVLAVFLRLGLTAFGGPAAHTGLFHDVLVRRRRWLDEADFLDLVAATSVIPGPNSSELAMAIGRRRAGRAGFAAATIGFIGPAIVLSIVLAWLSVTAATLSTMQAVLIGIDPVVVAILVVAVVGLVRAMRDDPARLAIVGLALAAYLVGVPEVVVLALGALLLVAWRAWRRDAGAGPPASDVPSTGADDSAGPPRRLPAIWPMLGLGAAAGGGVALLPMFLVFLKTGALLFGSGYVLVALLRSELVEGLGWLTERQLLDGIAVGQATPGPLLSTAGYLGFVLAGLPGAVVAAVAIFLPAVILVGLLDPIVGAIRQRPTAAAALAGAGAAAVGMMAGVTLQLGQATLLPAGLPAPVPIAVAIGATLALASGRIGPTVLIVSGAAIGLARVALVG